MNYFHKLIHRKDIEVKMKVYLESKMYGSYEEYKMNMHGEISNTT